MFLEIDPPVDSVFSTLARRVELKFSSSSITWVHPSLPLSSPCWQLLSQDKGQPLSLYDAMFHNHLHNPGYDVTWQESFPHPGLMELVHWVLGDLGYRDLHALSLVHLEISLMTLANTATCCTECAIMWCKCYAQVQARWGSELGLDRLDLVLKWLQEWTGAETLQGGLYTPGLCHQNLKLKLCILIQFL